MKNISKIIKLAKPLHGLFGLIALLITLGALIDLSVPLLLKRAIDLLTTNKIKFHGWEDMLQQPFKQVILLLVGIYLLNLATQGLSNLSSRLGDHFAGKLRKYLTETFFEKALTLSQSYYDSELSGKIVNQLNRGIQVITDFFNTATNFIVPSFLQAIFTILLLSYYNPSIAIFVTFLFPIYIYLSAASTRNWAKFQQQRNIYEDKVRGRLSESIVNIRLVRGFNNQLRELHTVSEGLSQSNIYFGKQSRTFHMYDFIRNASLHTILLGVYVMMFLKAFQGLSSFGEIVLVIQLVNQIRRPLFAMSFVLGRIQEAETGSKEYFHVLDLPSRELLNRSDRPREIIADNLELNGVSFAYKTGHEVLRDISFTIAKNEMAALVGKSGAGKTTIASLIMKFYDPSKGDIKIGGVSYGQLSTFDVRHYISLVFQDHELFSTSIRENVAYGSMASDAEVQRSLELAQMWDFVKELPKGMESEVGERGVKLSGGQKQRIQIARAILKNAPILILDEATSSLDAQSEAQVQEALGILMKDRVVIVIAHRFSTIRDADKIIVLDKGTIIDQGRSKELAKRPGIYQDLLRYQIEGNKKLLESFELY